MKNVFELFGFLSMACISAAIIFMLMGKKDGLKGNLASAESSEYSEVAGSPNAPRSVTKGIRDSYASDSGSARRSKKGDAAAPSAGLSAAATEERLKDLYGDAQFVAQTAKKWKSAVEDAADEYNVKPQFLLANAIVQAFLGGYNGAQLNEDAARHAGDRVLSAVAAAKRYKYAWSIQKLTEEHHLDRYFASEMATASASADRLVTHKNTTAKSAPSARAQSTRVTPNTQNDPVEEGFRNMVAKEYGFGSWNGLNRLADPEMKADAQRRVRSLMMAARIK